MPSATRADCQRPYRRTSTGTAQHQRRIGERANATWSAERQGSRMSAMPIPLTVGVALLGGGAITAGAPAAWRVARRQPGSGVGRSGDTSPGRITVRELIAVFAAGAAGGAAVAARIGWDPALPGWLVAVVGSTWLAIVDLRVRRLPAVPVVGITATAAILLGLTACVKGEGWRLLFVTAGAAGMRLAYRVNQAVIGGMGAGDLRMAYLLGGVGGWSGWPGWMTAALLPFALSAAGGGLMLLVGRRRWGESVPFGPAAVLGVIAALLLRDR